MKIFRYFLEFILVIFFFLVFKIIGLKLSSDLGGIIGKYFGPLFRKKIIAKKNILIAFPDLNEKSINEMIERMWKNIGRIFGEYIHINKFSIIDNSKKLKESQGCFTKENVAFIENYCKTNDLDLTDLAIVNSVKSILQKMISNYFKNRNKLYDTIIKKLIKFNSKTNEIENINPSLTYAKIVDLTEQTKNILLDLHIDVFKSLNIIINKIRITLLEKNSKQSSQSLESKQLLESSQSLEPNQSFEPSQPYEPSQSFEPIVKGGKTRKKHYKKQYKKRNKKTKKYTSK